MHPLRFEGEDNRVSRGITKWAKAKQILMWLGLVTFLGLGAVCLNVGPVRIQQDFLWYLWSDVRYRPRDLELVDKDGAIRRRSPYDVGLTSYEINLYLAAEKLPELSMSGDRNQMTEAYIAAIKRLGEDKFKGQDSPALVGIKDASQGTVVFQLLEVLVLLEIAGVAGITILVSLRRRAQQTRSAG